MNTMKTKKIVKMAGLVILALIGCLLLLSLFGTVVHAGGLVDDTVDAANEYSKYALSHYQLDFFVDSSWDWLPWNWTDGIGKGIQYALYAITNFIWTVSLYISNATGYVVQEAYQLNFISDTANEVGRNMQTLAGVTQDGFSREGFYVGFLLILVLILGIYVAYTGLFKRETTKAVRAALNFVVVFILSASFIAYAPNYIEKINSFSSDVSTAALSLGTKIVLPDSESEGKDSVDLIRDSLFAIQVKQPWLLLQYGTSDIESLGAERVESLLAAEPDTEARQDVIKEEIEGRENANLSVKKTMSRMGTVFFLFFFNIGISIFIFLLIGMMIFSQVLFIIFAMFLPMSFLLSMIPTFEGKSKEALTKLFNTIMMRAGITLIITAAFSISTMLYKISTGYPFFMVAFLQIVTFAGIYFKLGDLMGMFSLQSADSQQMGRKIFRRPYMFMRQRGRRMERTIGRSIRAGAATVTTGAAAGAVAGSLINSRRNSGKKPDASRPATSQKQATDTNMGKRAGAKVGAALDGKNRIKDKALAVGETVRDMPTQARYAVHSSVSQLKENAVDFKRGIVEEQASRQQIRSDRQRRHRQTIAQKRMELERGSAGAESVTTAAAPAKETALANHKRPAVKPIPRIETPTVKAATVELGKRERPTVQTVRESVAANHGQTNPTRQTANQTVKQKLPISQRTEPRKTAQCDKGDRQ